MSIFYNREQRLHIYISSAKKTICKAIGAHWESSTWFLRPQKLLIYSEYILISLFIKSFLMEIIISSFSLPNVRVFFREVWWVDMLQGKEANWVNQASTYGRSQLSLESARPEDSGNYTCTIEAGEILDSISYSLKIQGEHSPESCFKMHIKTELFNYLSALIALPFEANKNTWRFSLRTFSDGVA